MNRITKVSLIVFIMIGLIGIPFSLIERQPREAKGIVGTTTVSLVLITKMTTGTLLITGATNQLVGLAGTTLPATQLPAGITMPKSVDGGTLLVFDKTMAEKAAEAWDTGDTAWDVLETWTQFWYRLGKIYLSDGIHIRLKRNGEWGPWVEWRSGEKVRKPGTIHPESDWKVQVHHEDTEPIEIPADVWWFIVPETD